MTRQRALVALLAVGLAIVVPRAPC